MSWDRRSLYTRDPDLLPALAIASAVFLAEGVIPDYKSFIETLESQGHCDTVKPDLEVSEKYHRIYQKYKNIYPLVREFTADKEQIIVKILPAADCKLQ